MAVKYRIQYTSVDGVDYTCDISNPSYAGSVIELDGSVEYGLNPVETLDHPIRSKYLRITVTATTSQDLEDLLTSGERYWRVEFYRDVNKIFFGYLTSDKSPQSFVQDSWDLTLDALDPLAFLEDLAYVDNLGANFNGYDQLAYIIANCLKRGFESTSEEFNILAYVPYDYRTRLTATTYTEYTSGNFIKLCGINQDDFIDSDTDEVLSCQDVLDKVLSSLQLTITQINGDTWLLMHYYFLSNSLASTYINYLDSDGDTLAGTPPNPFSNQIIYTDTVAGASTRVIHINENQQYYFNYPLSKVVINHEFNLRQSLLDNPTFDGGTTGVSMPGWGFSDFGDPVDDGTFKVYRFDSAVNTDPTAVVSASNLRVEDGQRFKLKVVAETNFANAQMRIQVRYITDSGTTYYLAYNYGTSQSGDFFWSITESNIVQVFWDEENNGLVDVEFTFEYELPPIPNTFGELEVEFLGALPTTTSNTTDFITLHETDFLPSTQDITGNSTIAERTDTTAVKSEKYELYANTDENNAACNTIVYLANELPIVGVIDKLSDDSNWRKLGYIHARNKIISNKLKKFFTGDFWNFFEPHQLVSLNDLENATVYRVLEYSFDTRSNVGTYKLEHNRTEPQTMTITTSDVYANTIKPTIK